MELKREEQNASTGELEAALAGLRRHIDERFTAIEEAVAALARPRQVSSSS